MLQRASSDAGYRLRRAKSVPSIVDRPSESARVPVRPEHAEKAAVEAYRRAYHVQMSTMQARPARKRSGTTNGRFEGSHFDQSRTGGRIGRSRANTVPDNAPKAPQRRSTKAGLKSTNNDDGTKTITLPRQAIDTRPRAHTDAPRP